MLANFGYIGDVVDFIGRIVVIPDLEFCGTFSEDDEIDGVFGVFVAGEFFDAIGEPIHRFGEVGVCHGGFGWTLLSYQKGDSKSPQKPV